MTKLDLVTHEELEKRLAQLKDEIMVSVLAGKLYPLEEMRKIEKKNLCPVCGADWDVVGKNLDARGTEDYAIARTILDNCEACHWHFTKKDEIWTGDSRWY